MRRDKSGLLPKHNTRPTRWAEYTALYSADTETKKKKRHRNQTNRKPPDKVAIQLPWCEMPMSA